MEIVIDSLIIGASKANGAVVIIDVFRAFTTAALAISQGAKNIYLVSDIEDATDYVYGRLQKKENLKRIVVLLKMGIPIKVIFGMV